MSWTAGQFARIGDADELRLASRRSDGTLRPFTTMWVVRADSELYVRSAGGPDRPWYRHALASRRAGSALAASKRTSASPRPNRPVNAEGHAD
jgi:hypothetical protein